MAGKKTKKETTPKEVKVKLKAVKNLAGFGLAYFAGDELELPKERADLLSKLGVVEKR